MPTLKAKETGRSGLSMQLRLFIFFLFFLCIVMLGLMVILQATGTFRTGGKETRTFLSNELSHLSQDVYKNYGALSVQAVALSQGLSSSIENHLESKGVTPGQLADHPELLESLLGEELPILKSALENVKSSGAFLILDATVNPDLPGAQDSKSGLYLKNMEPNIINASFPNLRLLRGPASVSHSSGINFLPQWKLEFDIGDSAFWHLPLETAIENPQLPLSRLYYWCPQSTLPGDSEAVMRCSVPLAASDGTVFGVCGFEISAMLFKLSYAPDDSVFSHLFCVLSPLEEGRLDVSAALFAGSCLSNLSCQPQLNGVSVSVQNVGDIFSLYGDASDTPLAGLHTQVRLYPSDSPFAGEEWAVALMMPQKDLQAKISGANHQLLLLLALLMLLSILGASYFSRRYIKPVVGALNLVKSERLAEVPKTRILEIDDLIEFLAKQDEADGRLPQSDVGFLPSQMFQEFLHNIGTLSMAERAVFDLYLKGHTAKEIADILCLSINTIKTHNKRIYMKLGVTSRKELMVYVQMMKEAGRI